MQSTLTAELIFEWQRCFVDKGLEPQPVLDTTGTDLQSLPKSASLPAVMILHGATMSSYDGTSTALSALIFLILLFLSSNSMAIQGRCDLTCNLLDGIKGLEPQPGLDYAVDDVFCIPSNPSTP